jgi:hypothetical protein
MRPEIAAILTDVSRWVRARQDVHGLLLVGSYPSGKARLDSDVDLVIVADAPKAYENADWVQAAVGQRPIRRTQGERFGNVWSLFAMLADGPEIEFSFAEPSWLKADPPAPEVCRIVCTGVVVLHDPHGQLLALCQACGVKPQYGATMGPDRPLVAPPVPAPTRRSHGTGT